MTGDKMAADMDSNGWPPSGRDRALRAMRKGFAVHLAGDQHLASTIQYGVEDSATALSPSASLPWPTSGPGGGIPPSREGTGLRTPLPTPEISWMASGIS